jgi:GH35 family endo-1,4-beta-xylanase
VLCCGILLLGILSAPAREPPRNLVRPDGFTLYQPTDSNIAALTNAAAAGKPGGNAAALRIEIRKATDPFYNIVISQPVKDAVPEKVRLRFSFWARSSAANPIRAVVEKAGAPWTSIAETSPTLTAEWKSYCVTGVTRSAYAAEEIAVRFQVGHQAGDVEVTGIMLENLGQESDWAAAEKAIAPAAIQSRIEKCRQGDLTVKVVRADGKPVQKAVVKVAQTRHAFLFGCNLFGLDLRDSSSRQKDYQRQFAELFNYATLPFYWASFEPEAGKPDYAHVDAMARWCTERGITTKGHPLIWHSIYPEWAPRTAREAIPVLKQRVIDVVTHYRDSIRVWDVLNEINNATVYSTKNGVGAWVQRDGSATVVQTALGWARDTIRDGKGDFTLIYNDFNTGEQNLDLLAGLKERGALPDAVGIQSHMFTGAWPLEEVWQTAEKFSRFGPVHFTELSVISGPIREFDSMHPPSDWKTTPEGETEQADYVEKFYSILFSHPSLRAITWWDFSDAGSYMRAPAGLIRGDMTPKPVYDRLLRLTRKTWWTRTEAETGAGGTCTVRAFYGDYEIAVTDAAGQTVKATANFPMGSGSKTVTVTLP